MSANLRVAIVGGATLKGKELASVLNELNFPARDIRLLDDDESLGQLETMGDEVAFVQSVTEEQFENVDVVFFASDESFTERTWTMARDSGAAIIDLSYGLEKEPGSVVRSSWLELELGRPFTPQLQPAPAIVAHPAAVILALLLLRVQKTGSIRTAAATVIEPASERGRQGMDELHEQTVSLLSFRELPKQVFDAQVAFNVTAQCGPNRKPSLASIAQRITAHYERITLGLAPIPALQLLQGPSFHGHAVALYVEMEQAVAERELVAALAGEHVSIVTQAEDVPNNVNAAGQDQVLVTVRQDEHRGNGVWLWAAADNLRLSALNAVECAKTVAASRPRGKVQ